MSVINRDRRTLLYDHSGFNVHRLIPVASAFESNQIKVGSQIVAAMAIIDSLKDAVGIDIRVDPVDLSTLHDHEDTLITSDPIHFIHSFDYATTLGCVPAFGNLDVKSAISSFDVITGSNDLLCESLAIIPDRCLDLARSDISVRLREIGDPISSWIIPRIVKSGWVPDDNVRDAIIFSGSERLDRRMIASALEWACCGGTSVVVPPASQVFDFISGKKDDDAMSFAAGVGVGGFHLDMSMGPSCRWANACSAGVSDGSGELLWMIAQGKPVIAMNPSWASKLHVVLPRSFKRLGSRIDAEDLTNLLTAEVDPSSLGAMWTNASIETYIRKFAVERESIAAARRLGSSISALAGIHVGRPAIIVGNGASSIAFDLDLLKESLDDPVVFALNRRCQSMESDYVLWVDEEMTDLCSQSDATRVSYASLVSNPSYSFSGIPWPPKDRFEAGMMDDDEVWEATSGGVAIQVASAMGCDPVILVGFDCAYYDLDGVAASNVTWEGKPGDRFLYPDDGSLSSRRTLLTDRRLLDHSRAICGVAEGVKASVRKIGHHGTLASIPVDEALTAACRLSRRKVLIHRDKGGIGDAIQLTPAIRLWHFAYDNDLITVATHFPEVFENCPYVDGIIDLNEFDAETLVPKFEKVIRLDKAITLHPDGSMRDIDDKQPCYDSYIEAMGLSSSDPTDKVHQLFPSEEDKAFVSEINLPDEFIVLCPSYRSKRFGWTADDWSAIAQELRKTLPVVTVGCDPQKSPHAEPDMHVPGVDLDLVGVTQNVRQLMLILQRAKYLLTWDTGTLHVAGCIPSLGVHCIFANRMITGSDNLSRRAPALNPLSSIELVPTSDTEHDVIFGQNWITDEETVKNVIDASSKMILERPFSFRCHVMKGN